MVTVLLIACLTALGGYLFVSGFHDAPNAVAIPVRARALTPKVAVTISAFFNVMGFLMCAVFISRILTPEWLDLPTNDIGLAIVFTALFSQIIWGFITWMLRMPSSSTHGLIGGLLGALWATNAIHLPVKSPFIEPMFQFFTVPLLVVPAIVFALSWVLMFPLYKLALKFAPAEVNQASRNALSFTNSLISLGHGVLSAQRSMIIFGLICATAQIQRTPLVLILAVAGFCLALIIGTLLGGWRIAHTIAHRLVRVDPLRGAVAQTVTALAMIIAPVTLSAPVSSSHLSASAVLGSGINQRFSAVRPRVATKLVLTWLATIPATFVLSAIFFLALSPLL